MITHWRQQADREVKMIRTKHHHNGAIPPFVDIYDEEDECPGAGYMIAVGGPNVVAIPPELGGGFAKIVEQGQIDVCPRCQSERPGLIVTDRDLAVVCCQSCEMYSWIRKSELYDG